jgi:cobalt-zinc-cadmium efflux system protein
MAHDHATHGSHTHAHHRRSHADATGRAFAIGVGLNAAFVIAEVVGGIIGNSVALLADAAHNFSDVLGLTLAWGAARLARRKPSARHTYGLRRSTILASLANAVLLLVGVGGVSWEAIERLRAPSAEPHGAVVLVVAAIGVVINGGSALLFVHSRKQDANVRGAFLHLVADAAVSVGVVIAGIMLLTTGWTWVDGAVSLIVSAVILIGTWSLLRDALNLALDAVPVHIDPKAVRAYLEELPHVLGVHDLHIWALSTTETALTGHLVVDGQSCDASFLRRVGHALETKFGIHHSTIQMDPPDAPECVCAAEEIS